jgi:Predicted integral membrane protein (DUF2269)
MPVGVQFYDVVVWLHVSAVVLAFGPTFAFGIYLATAGRNHRRSIPAVLEAQGVVLRTMYTIGTLVVIASGIYLAADRWDFGEVFVIVGLVVSVGVLVLTYGFFLPNDRRALEAAQRDIEAAGSGEVEFGEEFNRASMAGGLVGAIVGLILILTIYFMAAKPFL